MRTTAFFKHSGHDILTSVNVSARPTAGCRLPAPMPSLGVKPVDRKIESGMMGLAQEIRFVVPVVHERSEIGPTYLLEPKRIIAGFHGMGGLFLPLGKIVHRYE